MALAQKVIHRSIRAYPNPNKDPYFVGKAECRIERFGIEKSIGLDV